MKRMSQESYTFEKVTGGDAKIYAMQDGTKSNELISRLVEYTLEINNTSYDSLAEPVGEEELSVGDEIIVYADASGNETAYFAHGQIVKGATTHSAGRYTITSIAKNGSAVSSIAENEINDNDVVSLTLTEVH